MVFVIMVFPNYHDVIHYYYQVLYVTKPIHLIFVETHIL